MIGKTMLTAVSAAVLLAAGPAGASTIATNTWYTFGFGNTVGSALTTPYATAFNPTSQAVTDGTWNFTLSGPATLTVTDLEISGDMFSFYDNGSLIGNTSTPCNACSSVSDNITAALNDSNFSHGYFALGSGSHSLSGVYNGSIGGGDGAFIVSLSAVPLPASFPLLLSAFGLGGIALRRRRKTHKVA